jgi:hypothetical protein
VELFRSSLSIHLISAELYPIKGEREQGLKMGKQKGKGNVPCSILSSQSGHSHSSGATESSSKPAHAQWTLSLASTYSCDERHTGHYTIVGSLSYNGQSGLTISQTISCYPRQSLLQGNRENSPYSLSQYSALSRPIPPPLSSAHRPVLGVWQSLIPSH